MHMYNSDKGPSISIQLLEPMVYLVGPDGNSVLRGSVAIMSAHRSYTLASLELLFEGHLTLSWMTENKRKTKTATQQIAHQSLSLFPTAASTNSLLLSPGTSRCSFEFPLPPQLPATVESSEATVAYALTATMVTNPVRSRHKNPRTTKFTMPLTLAYASPLGGREDAQLMSGDNVVGVIDSLKQFTHWCQYHIIIEKAVAGQPLHMTLGLAPHIRGLVLENTYLEWTERHRVMDCCYGSTIQHRLTASSHHRQHPRIPVNKPWHGAYTFTIPSYLVPSATYAPYYTIDHIVTVTIVISFPAKSQTSSTLVRCRRTIRFQTDMVLAGSAPIANPAVDDSRLPAYHSSQVRHDRLLLQGPPIYTPSSPYLETLCATSARAIMPMHLVE
ncbi:hypothetical protein BX666DRAFT_946589 [Dichotomocladium elegans]|nr:hypothetical protein BX666DRAFT_946589 [Dichotomocladium elegans]